MVKEGEVLVSNNMNSSSIINKDIIVAITEIVIVIVIVMIVGFVERASRV